MPVGLNTIKANEEAEQRQLEATPLGELKGLLR